MNALIRKEVRLLLPSFAIGLVLALSIWLFPENPSLGLDFDVSLGVLAFMVSPAMLVLMTLGSFGRELSAGTFSFMLSQPVPRSRVWWTKTLLLALATGILWAVWWFSLSSTKNFLAIPQEDRNDAFVTAAIFAIVVYSGGLWTTLLLRQLAAAFWFTLLTPAALTIALVALLGNNSEEANPVLESALVVALVTYSVAGFLFSRWLFLRAQDTHWTGGEVTLPEVRGLAGWFGRRGERRHQCPLAALWAKEFQLHQSQFVLAGLLALVHLVVLAVRNWGGDFKNFPVLEFVLQNFLGVVDGDAVAGWFRCCCRGATVGHVGGATLPAVTAAHAVLDQIRQRTAVVLVTGCRGASGFRGHTDATRLQRPSIASRQRHIQLHHHRPGRGPHSDRRSRGDVLGNNVLLHAAGNCRGDRDSFILRIHAGAKHHAGSRSRDPVHHHDLVPGDGCF